jgi:checkpoint serine/threonine-protein kinase
MANLDSPTSRKIKRKKSAEPTVTIHTREAMDEIYGIFNQPLQSAKDPMEEAEESEEETDEDDDDDYTSAGESTETGRISATTSEFGDLTTADFTTQSVAPSGHSDDEDSEDEPDEGGSASKWSEFTASKHIPKGENGSGDHEDTQEDFSEASSLDQTDEEPKESPEEELMTPTSPPPELVGDGSKFVPVPPEDCEIPTNPYRDPQYVAQSRLPFMTPIVEKTETSIGAATALAKLTKDYFNSKTPCREKSMRTPTKPSSPGAEVWSSPFLDDLDGVAPSKVSQPILKKEPTAVLTARPKEQAIKAPVLPKGPIVLDAQCNPIDDQIRSTILSKIQPPLSSYEGYFDRSNESNGKGADIRKFAKSLSKTGKGGSDKTTGNLIMPPVLRFEGSERQYMIKRELGKGAFAPVYLVESEDITQEVREDQNEPAVEMGKGAFGLQRADLEAIKMEDPPSVWEFYMLRQAKRRLGVSRPMESIVPAYEMHLFKDECYLIEQYSDQGTLLDLVNLARADSTTGGVMDEQVAMFFTIELFRTVEALHAKGLLHGDIKADNLLVRFKNIANEDGWSPLYHRDGTSGWSDKGITLIDFGRGIDMKAFKPEVQFIADWKTSEADCAEMREMRPWTYQIDYHGVAGVVHTLLFGKYLETVAERGAILGAGQTKTYKIRESLKRYWQTDIWSEAFDLMLNPLTHLEGEEGTKLPVLKGMRGCRERMETWLEANCEKGVGLKALLRRLEISIKERKR